MAEVVSRVQALIDAPIHRAELRDASFVIERARLVFVQTPKAACTSMKNYLLDVLDTQIEGPSASLIPITKPEMLVHDRALFPAPSLVDLDAASLREALLSPDWLRVCLVRNPFDRCFAAWQDKLLVGEPTALPYEPSARVLQSGRLDVRTAYADFVADLSRRSDSYFTDWHFRPQHEVLRLDVLPYTDVVHVEELDTFFPRLADHLDGLGLALPPVFPRINEGLGLEMLRCYDETSVLRVRDLYAEDFESFGYEPSIEPLQDPLVLDATSTALLGEIWDRNRCIAAMAQQARANLESAHALQAQLSVERLRFQEDLAAAQKEHASLQGELSAVQAELTTGKGELSTAQAELGTVGAELSTVESELGALRARWDSLERRSTVRVFRRLQRLNRSLRVERAPDGVSPASVAVADPWSLEISTEISPNDEMYAGNTDHYMGCGRSALQCIQNALVLAGADEPKRILDLPSGHGRVLRALRASFPAAEITACDLNRDGVDYCAQSFDAIPAYSVEDPNKIPLSGPYDLIWSGSLFTHLPMRGWDGFLRRFEGLLAPRGVAIFTTHGHTTEGWLRRGETDAGFSMEQQYGLTEPQVTELLEGLTQHGFGYVDYPNQVEYGISVSSRAFVIGRVQQLTSLRVVACLEHAWDGHQDVFVCVKT